MQYEFKCEKCGNIMRAAFRPHLCSRCGAGRRHIHRSVNQKPATK